MSVDTIMNRAPSNPEAAQLSIAWIRRILDKHQISATNLARRSELAASTVLRMLNDPNHRFTPSLKTLQAISTAMREPIPDDIFHAHNIGSSQMWKTDEGEREARRERLKTMRSQETVVQSQSGGTAAPAEARMLTVSYVSNLPQSLHPAVFRGTRVACPSQLLDDPTAFAFYMPDNSLAPVIPGGTLLYATKVRDPQIGDIILITSEDGRSKVRIVKDISSEGITVEKGGTFDDIEVVSFDDIEQVAVVAGAWRL